MFHSSAIFRSCMLSRCLVPRLRQSCTSKTIGSAYKIFGQQGLTKTFFTSSAVNITEKVQINGMNIHYEKVGQGDHVVLLLPGAIGTGRNDFGPQLEGLDHKKFTLIAWDPPGYGKSRPPDRNYDDFYSKDADAAAALMKQLGCPLYSVIGWSDGGITGLILSARYNKSVKKLVVFGASAYLAEGDVKAIENIRDVNKWSDRAREGMLKTYGPEYFEKLWNGYVQAYRNIYTKNKGDLCINELQNITCPTLILHGDKDPLVMPEHPGFLSEHIKNAKVVHFPEGKHNIHLKYAKEFNRIVEEFLLS